MSDAGSQSSGTPVHRNINPTAYWDGDNFQTYSFAEQLTKEYEFATSRAGDTIFWHDGLTYQRDGEQMLRGEVRKLLTDSATNEIVNEVVRNVRVQTRQNRENIFDLPPEKIVVKNGVVDLITGEFTPQHKSGFPGTQTYIGVEYDEDAFPERFNDFLFEVLHPDDVSVMWELIGFCLYRGYPFQKAALLLGNGANGKSTLLNALTEFLGKTNVSTVELQDFSGDKFASAELEGKLANIAADLSDNALEQTGTFKELTGGDRIRAQRKYKQPFQFENYATLIFSANTPPSAEDDTHAYKRRWLKFEFPNTFDDEDSVPQSQLLGEFEEEHAGILSVAIDSFRDLWGRGEFKQTVYESEHEQAHERATNPAYQFAQDEIVASEDNILRQQRAYTAFEQWCDEHEKTQQGKEALKRCIRKVHTPNEGKDPNDGRYKAYVDIALDSDNTADENHQKRLQS